jgi:hypothetical protein
MVAFIGHELRVQHPLVDLKVLRDRNLAVGTFLIGVIGVIIYGTTTLLPLFLQDLLGYTAYNSGFAPRYWGSHQDVMAAHMTPYDPPFRNLFSQLRQFLALHTRLASATQRAYGIMYGILHQQAMLLSFVDDFRLLAVLTLCCLPFLVLFRKGELRKRGMMTH